MIMKRLGIPIVFLFILSSALYAEVYEDPQIQADKYFNEGNALLRAGNFSQAIEQYNKALELVEDHRYYYQKAIALLRMNRFDEAINAFTNAIELDTVRDAANLGLAHAYMGKGHRFFDAGNFTDAIVNFQQAVKYHQDPRYYNHLGVALRRVNRENEAIEAFENAIELDPGYAVAFVGLGATYVSLEQFDDAIEAYSKAIELDSTLTHAKRGLAVSYTAKGNILLERGRVREAITVLRDAVESWPDHGQAYLLLAVAYNNTTQSSMAEEMARKALALRDRGRKGAEWFELGRSLKYQGRIQGAREAFREASKDPQYRRSAEYELEELERL